MLGKPFLLLGAVEHLDARDQDLFQQDEHGRNWDRKRVDSEWLGWGEGGSRAVSLLQVSYATSSPDFPPSPSSPN